MYHCVVPLSLVVVIDPLVALSSLEVSKNNDFLDKRKPQTVKYNAHYFWTKNFFSHWIVLLKKIAQSINHHVVIKFRLAITSCCYRSVLVCKGIFNIVTN